MSHTKGMLTYGADKSGTQRRSGVKKHPDNPPQIGIISTWLLPSMDSLNA